MASITSNKNIHPKVIMHEVVEAEDVASTIAKTCTGFVGAFISNTDYNDDGELVNTLELYFATEEDVIMFNLRNR